MKKITDVVLNTYGIATYDDGSVEPFGMAYEDGLQINNDSQNIIETILADPTASSGISNILSAFCGNNGGNIGNSTTDLNELFQALLMGVDLLALLAGTDHLSFWDIGTSTYTSNSIADVGAALVAKMDRINIEGLDPTPMIDAGNAMINGTAYRGYRHRMVGNDVAEGGGWQSLTVLSYPEIYGVTGVRSYVFNTSVQLGYCKDLGENADAYVVYDSTGWDEITMLIFLSFIQLLEG